MGYSTVRRGHNLKRTAALILRPAVCSNRMAEKNRWSVADGKMGVVHTTPPLDTGTPVNQGKRNSL